MDVYFLLNEEIHMENVEREIDLIDLMESICKKWRSIILVMVIGLIIGGVISTARGIYYRNAASKDIVARSLSKQLAKASEEIDRMEDAKEIKETLENNVRTYNVRQKMYEMQEDYMKNSLYFAIDEDSASRISLLYYIDNNYTVTYPSINTYNNIKEITQYYYDRINSNELYEKLLENVYPGSKIQYLRELISVGNPSLGNIRINIVADSKTNVEKISGIIKEEMELITGEAVDTYGDCVCLLQSELYTEESDSNLAASHAQEVQKLVDYNNSIQNLTKSMSGAQLDYFNARTGQLKLEKIADEEDDIKPLIFYISKRIIAIVGIIGAFLIVAVYGCAYIFGGSIKTEGDLALITGAINIGSLKTEDDHKHPIDRLIHSIFHRRTPSMDLNRRAEIAAGIITESMRAKDIKKLCIVSTVDIKEASGVSLLISALNDKGIDPEIADTFLLNPEGLKLANGSESVLILEMLKVSSFSDVVQEFRLLKMNDSKVLGCITA